MKLTKLKRVIGGTVSALMIASSIPFVASAADQQTTGNIGGYDYEMWNQNYTGTVSMNPGAGNFTCSWSGIENFLARMGKNFDSQKKNYKEFGNIVLTYDVEYTPRGNSYMCVYGWTRNPLMEYYIVEGWGDWRPPGNDGERKGTVTLNGNTYDIAKTMRYNQPSIEGTKTFPQYWSIRQTSGSANNQTNYMKGTIDVSKHFDAWSEKGLDMSGTLYEVSLNIEGYRSNGSANVKSINVTTGGSDSGSNNNQQQNNDWNNWNQPQQNNDWNSWNNWNQPQQNNDWNSWNNWDNNQQQNNDWNNWNNWDNNNNNQQQNNDWNNWNNNNNNQQQNNDWNNWNNWDNNNNNQQQNNDWNNWNNWDNNNNNQQQNNDWNNWNNWNQPQQNNDWNSWNNWDNNNNNQQQNNDWNNWDNNNNNQQQNSDWNNWNNWDNNNNNQQQNNDWNNWNNWDNNNNNQQQNNDWNNWNNWDNNNNNQQQNNDWNNWDNNNNNQQQNNDWNNWNNWDNNNNNQQQNNDWNNWNNWNQPQQNNDWNSWNNWNNNAQPANNDQGNSGKKLVAISFDDGASATSRQDPAYRIMDALIKNNMTATFFYVSDWIKTNEQVKFAYQNGMEVANHTKSHQSLGSLGSSQIRSEWEQCNSKLRSIIGAEPSHLMRLPYLDGGGQVKSALYDIPLISCGLDTQDWNGASKDQIVNTIKQAAQNGSLEGKIVLCHENYASTAAAMEEVLPWLAQNGYANVTISEMFAAKGKTLQGGQIYTQA